MSSNHTAISERLRKHGDNHFSNPRGSNRFVDHEQANALINDIENHPHAFVIACLMDRQIRAEKAWMIPYQLSVKLGDFRFKTLQKLDRDSIHNLMTQPEPLHRFSADMAESLFSAIERISTQYAGDASAIWAGRPSSAEVVLRFLEFRGVGIKIATMATNILVRSFGVELSDYYSIDISADTHVKQVFRRLGLIQDKASIDEVIYKARSLSPEFPGLLDFPCWEIGRNWCDTNLSKCEQCYMNDLCPSARSN